MKSARRDMAHGDNHLRAWREHRGLTQEQLADLVGTSGGVISDLEAGQRGLSQKWLKKLAPVFGTTPGVLLDHVPGDAENALVQAARAVPDRFRAQALRILQALSE